MRLFVSKPFKKEKSDNINHFLHILDRPKLSIYQIILYDIIN